MNKFVQLQAVGLAVLVASCGGGETMETAKTGSVALAAAKALASTSEMQVADQLMDWGESAYRNYFPEHQASLSNVGPFLYRHYSSGIYLGVVVRDDATYPMGGVYVLGGSFGGSPLKVGNVSDFAFTPPPAGPATAATCPAFTRSTYRFVMPSPSGTDTVNTVAAVVMDDAGTPQIAFPGEAPRKLTPGSAPCSFTLPDGSGLAVSPASVGLISSLEGTLHYPAIMFPEQSNPVSDLAGTWNLLSWSRRDPGGFGQPYTLGYGDLSITASGDLSAGKSCSVAVDLAGGCVGAARSGTFVENVSGGGFSGVGGDADRARLFAYRKGTEKMLVISNADGTLAFLTSQLALPLPAAGATSAVLNMTVNTAGAINIAQTNAIPGLSTNTNTISSVDAVTGTVVRSSSQDGGAATTQTLHYNAPLSGFIKRDAATGVAPSVFLPLRGMGVTVVSRLGASTPTTPGTGNGFLSLSAAQP